MSARARISVYSCFSDSHYNAELDKIAAQFYEEMDSRGYTVPKKTTLDYSHAPSLGSSKIQPVGDMVPREGQRKRGIRGSGCPNGTSIRVLKVGDPDRVDKEAHCVWPREAEKMMMKKHGRRWSLRGLIPF